MFKIELVKFIIFTFVSSCICLIMYILTAVLMLELNGIVLHETGAGIVALFLYFIVPFISLCILDNESEYEF